MAVTHTNTFSTFLHQVIFDLIVNCYLRSVDDSNSLQIYFLMDKNGINARNQFYNEMHFSIIGTYVRTYIEIAIKKCCLV